MTNLSDNEVLDDGWFVTTKRYVVVIDIMGFKDFVLRNTHDHVYNMMKNLNAKKKASENIKWHEIDSKLVKTTNYSDSIMIYSKDGSLDSLTALVNTTASFTYGLFLEGIPHKGALAYGTMTLDISNSIYFGQPLIDAFLLQEELIFYGIVIHATAEIEIRNTKPVLGFLSSYLCPFKNGAAKHLTIRPMFSIILNPESKTQKDLLDEAIKKLRYQTSGSLRKYIDVTENYLNTIVVDNV